MYLCCVFSANIGPSCQSHQKNISPIIWSRLQMTKLANQRQQFSQVALIVICSNVVLPNVTAGEGGSLFMSTEVWNVVGIANDKWMKERLLFKTLPALGFLLNIKFIQKTNISAAKVSGIRTLDGELPTTCGYVFPTDCCSSGRSHNSQSPRKNPLLSEKKKFLNSSRFFQVGRLDLEQNGVFKNKFDWNVW